MTRINSLNMGLDFEINVPSFISDLRALNGIAQGEFNAHIKSYESHMQSIMEKRIAAEAKYATAEEIRMRKMTELVKLHQEINLSQRAYNGMMRDINAAYTKSVIEMIRATQERKSARMEEERIRDLMREQTKSAQIIAEIRAQQKRNQVTNAYSAQSSADTLAAGQAAAQKTIDDIRRSALRDRVTSVMQERNRIHQTADQQLHTQTITNEIRRSADRDRITKLMEERAAARRLAQATATSESIIAIIRKEQIALMAAAAIQKRADDAAMVTKIYNSNAIIRQIQIQQRYASKAAAQERMDRMMVTNILDMAMTQEQRYTLMKDNVTAAFKRGTISALQYRQALAALQVAQTQNIRAYNSTAHAVTALSMGVEDFITVSSMQGFSMESMSFAFRAASNNISQALYIMYGATSGLYASLASIGVVLVGMAIPALYKYVTGAKASAEVTKALRLEVEALTRAYTHNVDQQKIALDFDKAKRDVVKIDSTTSAESKLQELQDKQKEIANTIERAKAEMAAQTEALWSNIIPAQTASDFEELFKFMGDNIHAGYRGAMREQLQEIRAEFNKDLELLGGKDAVANLERRMQAFTEGARSTLKKHGLLQEFANQNARGMNVSDVLAGGGLGSTNVTANVNAYYDDAAVIDNIQALLANEERLAEMAKGKNKSVEEYTKGLRESLETAQLIADTEAKIIALKEKEATLAAETKNQEIFDQMNEREAEFEALKEKSKQDSLRGADKTLFELGVKQRDLLLTQTGTYDELNALFNQELAATAKDLEKQLAGLNEINIQGQNAFSSRTDAVVSANKAIVDNLLSKPKEDKQAEMVQVLKAIREHLSGKKMLMEVIK